MTPKVKCFDFQAMSSAERQHHLHTYHIALTESEALKIQSLLKRPPSLAECILWGIQGSEHCSYKSTKKHLKTLCTDGPNVVSGAKEDAGIVAVCEDNQNRRYCIAISHESHNHPSQVVPFEGAATGIGGNVRDVCCMGAEVIANADSLRFGALNNPQAIRIAEEAVQGIASYSNALGVPNITGDVFHHDSFDDNCLVTAVTLGIVREDHIIHSHAPKNAVGYHLILVGKPTDNSGFGGASFASVDLNENDEANNRSAVQEPNAFLGRVLLKAHYDLFEQLQEKNLIDQVGFKDLGAGGIACASVELAESGGYGAEIFIERVPVSMPALDPSVILCAETQERYMWVVPPDLSEMITAHYNEKWQLPNVSSGACARVVGHIRSDDRYIVHHHDNTLIHARAGDITAGILYDRPSKKPTRQFSTPDFDKKILKATLEKLATHPALASQKPIYDSYDKQVQGRTIIERGIADAGVLQPFNSEEYPKEIRQTGVALSVSGNPFYGQIDPYWTAVNAVIDSVCKVIAVGAKPLAITDCLCFGNPENSEQMWELVSAINGLKDICHALDLPVVAGNVSLYNQNKSGKSIPASPLISCLGKLPDINQAITPQIKIEDSTLICLGKRLHQLGGSILYDILGERGSDLPTPDFHDFKKMMDAFFLLHQKNLIRSAKAIGYGGIIAAANFMNLPNIKYDQFNYSQTFWADESPGWLIEIDPITIGTVKKKLNDMQVDWYLISSKESNG